MPPITRIKRLLPLRPHLRVHPQSDRRATLRDLYTSGLVSIFRRDSVLRIWEPLRETPRLTATDPASD